MTDPNQTSTALNQTSTAADHATAAGAGPDTATELHALEDKVDAIGAELTKHEAADAASQTPKQTPSLGRIVIVREAGKKDAPGIIADIAEDTITCNVFRGDHIPHVASQLTQTDPKGTAAGWFWPPRV